MPGILERLQEHPVTANGLMLWHKGYAWVTDNLWPVYSVGVIVSAMCMLAASQEKQILADHLYGSNQKFASERSEILQRASKKLDDDIAFSIKQDVFSLPHRAFEAEYEARQ